MDIYGRGRFSFSWVMCVMGTYNSPALRDSLGNLKSDFYVTQASVWIVFAPHKGIYCDTHTSGNERKEL